jgi:predicted TIM-barrel fold metal-dependent hydrolase
LSGKVLYGTDAPMRDPRPQLGWVAYADISIEDKKKILGENMQRIMDRCFKTMK